MSGCGNGGGCGVGNKLNPGSLYIGIRINDNEDGKAPFCDTQGIPVQKGQRVVVEGEAGFEYAEVTNLRPMILKQCQLRDARRLVRIATDDDCGELSGEAGARKAVLPGHPANRRGEEPHAQGDPRRGDLRRPEGHRLLHLRDPHRLSQAGPGPDVPPPPADRDAAGRSPRRNQDARRHRSLRFDPLLLDLPEVVPPRDDQNGEKSESFAKPFQNIGDVRPPDVLSRLRGGGLSNLSAS